MTPATTTIKRGRGGARKGAGRKSAEPSVAISLKLPKSLSDYARSQANTNGWITSLIKNEFEKEEAYKAGYLACSDGIPFDKNPHANPTLHEQWKAGWEHYNTDYPAQLCRYDV